MKKQILLIMAVATMVIMSKATYAQWQLTGNAGTTSSNYIGTTDAQSLRFRTNGTQQMIINTQGKVGIGTGAPSYKLDVSNSTLLRSLNISNSFNTTTTTYGMYAIANNPGTGNSFGTYSEGRGAGGLNYGVYAKAREGSSNYAFYGVANTVSQTSPSGIGVYGTSTGTGTTNYGLMGVAGGAGTTNYGVYGSATSGTTNWAGYFLQNCFIGGSLGIGTSAVVDSRLSITQTGTTASTLKLMNTSKGPNVSFAHYGTTGDWIINSAANTGKVIIQNNTSGIVTIGTSQAATGYRLSVKGKIMCEELKVLLQASWPDYVFSKNYNLMPLKQLEEYINTNSHLPGVPSAEQIENEGGIAVGEMQTILVKKLEEANLYILELNRRIEELEARIK